MLKKVYLIAHNIRSAYNVGAILRTADGAGITKVYLTGYTPKPFKEGKDPYITAPQKMIAKTALGAQNFVDWEEKKEVLSLIEKLKKEKFSIVALEQDEKSVKIKETSWNFPTAVIIGNETEGIDKKILRQCDSIVEIPMRGHKESLNVSVATGVAVYEILK
jgi:tRNA G18 (ribose-2'-O)-methylase SpoU